MPWYGVIQSIPAKWKIILKRNTPEQKSNIDKIRHFSSGIFMNGSFITALNLTSKIVYQQYIEKLFKVPIARLYFSRKLNVRDEYWPTIYTLASKLTIDSKMRIFQYKILNNILYLNKALYKMKIADSPLCTFCSQEDEMIEHIFLSCEYSKRLWKNVKNWVNKEQDLPNLNPKNVVIRFVEDNSGSVVKNLLLLLYKRYICNNRISKSALSFDGFKMFVKCVMKIEEKIALRNKRLSQHCQKWDFLTELL